MGERAVKTFHSTGSGRGRYLDVTVESRDNVVVSGASAGGAFEVRNESGSDMAAGALVYISGYNATLGIPTVTLADADAGDKLATLVLRSVIVTGTTGLAHTSYLSTATLNTDAASAAGDPVYLSTSAGGWVATAPTGADDAIQIVGHVVVKSATVGQVRFNLGDAATIGTNELQASAVTEAKITAGTITNTSINASAAIARSKLATDSVFVDLEERLKGADGADLALAETADDFFRNIGTNQWLIDGEATINETELSSGWFAWVLPDNYVAGGTITLRAAALVVLAGDAANDAASTIDMEARLVTAATGAVGSDLVTTAATTLATAGANYDFVVTPTNLVAGDKLVCKLATSVVETAGGTGAANSRITRLGALIQVKG